MVLIVPEPPRGARRWFPRPRSLGPVIRFALAAAAGALGVAALAAALFDGGTLVALALHGAGAALAALGLARSHPHSALGLANLVTLLRMMLVAVLAAPLVPGGSAAGWVVVALAAVALALDGVDGWLARRQGLASGFGARFDMEVDSALALVLAALAWAEGTVGPVVLLLGLPRYVFVAASRGLPWLDGPLPDRRSRKLVCVVQIATLIALHLPGLPAAMAPPLVLAVTAALLWSFGGDVLWLWRARG